MTVPLDKVFLSCIVVASIIYFIKKYKYIKSKILIHFILFSFYHKNDLECFKHSNKYDVLLLGKLD